MKNKHQKPTTSRAAFAKGARSNRTFSPVLSSVRSAIGFFGEPNLMGKSAFAVLSTALLIAAPAHGAPIAYDGFAYTAGTINPIVGGALAGNNGGTGDWGDPFSAWVGAGGTVVSAADAYAAWGGTDNSGGVHRALNLATRAISTTFNTGETKAPLYFSAEFQKNGGQGIVSNSNGYSVFLALTNNDSTVTNSITNTARIGLNKPNNQAHQFNARIGTGTSTATHVNTQFGSYAFSGDDATTPPYVGSTVLLVGKIEFNVDGVNDRLTVWADPTDVETAVASVVVEGANIGWETPTFVKTQAFNLADNSTPRQGDGFIDNIRIGTTWADVVPSAGTAFDTWAATGTLGPVTFNGDTNGDGVKDGLAFLLGAVNPNVSAIGRLPTVSESGGGLILNFNCLPIAARGTATLKVAHSSDLGDLDPWTSTVDVVPDADDAVPDNNVTFVVGAGPAGPPALNSVTATIDAAAAADGKLFGRLVAEQQ